MSSAGQQSESTVGENDEGACAVVEAVDQLGSRWRLVVLHNLAQEGELRFNELKRASGASSRTLSRVLDDLGEADLVERRVEDRPIATFYSLSEKGEALCPVFGQIREWAEQWVDVESEA
jgi:DNA-binding HxlR family transcriptional regulator